MKVLFASLSRIGDYLQHLAVVRAWSIENPDFEVHILVNDLIPTDLLRMNSKFKHLILPRFEYQNRINQVSTPLLYPFWSLRKLVQQLRAENYVQLVDLTYQAQSLAFLKLVKPGFSYTEKEVSLINEYLNLSDEGHLIDKIKVIHDISMQPKEIVSSVAKRVLFQVTTSDSKKNIDLPKWRVLIDELKSDFSSLEFLVLGSPAERKNLSQIFSPSELITCTFHELESLMDSEARLVSLDTSLKHFAAEYRVPTVEISVGSSHWIKNAAYQSGNYIFSADFHCRPCVHSQACPLGRNQCQDAIDFKLLRGFIARWVVDADVESFSMKTKVRNRNLSIQRGDQWNRKANPASPYL